MQFSTDEQVDKLALEVDAVAETPVQLLLEEVLSGNDVCLLGLEGRDAALQSILLLLAIWMGGTVGGQ